MEADLEYPALAVAPLGGRREGARPDTLADRVPGVGGAADRNAPVEDRSAGTSRVAASPKGRYEHVGSSRVLVPDSSEAPIPSRTLNPAPAPDVAASALEWLRHLADGDRLTLLDDDALLADLRVLEEVGRLADAGRMFAAGVVAQRSDTSKGAQRLCTREGFTKPEDMIAQVTGTSTRTVRERIRQAEPLQHATTPTPGPRHGANSGNENQHDGDGPDGGGAAAPFPLLRLALRAGLLSPETANVITTALTPALELGVPPVRVREAERVLLVAALGADVITSHVSVFGHLAPDVLTEAQSSHTQARGVPLTQLMRLSRSWNRVLTQDATPVGGLADAREVRGRQEARRSLTIHPPRDGTRRIEGELLPDAAAQLERLLDAYLNPRTDSTAHSGTDTGGGTDIGGGTETRGGGRPDPRSPRQKRHDALAGVLTQAAAVPSMPLMGGGAPTLVVTTTLDQLNHPQGVAFLQGSHHEADSDVDVTVAHHTGCVGAVQRIVLGPQGRVVELGAPQRVFTAHQRRAIATRDGGCIIPGCEVPATWCEVHHVHEWQHGGPTHTDNGVTLCWHHHRNLDQLGWDIRMRDGTPWVRPPAAIDPDRRWHPAQASLHLSFEQHPPQHPDTSGEPRTGSGGSVPDAAEIHMTRVPSADGSGVRSAGGTSPPTAEPGPASTGEGTGSSSRDQMTRPTPDRRGARPTDRRGVPGVNGTSPPVSGEPPSRHRTGPLDTPDGGELRTSPDVQEHLFALSG